VTQPEVRSWLQFSLVLLSLSLSLSLSLFADECHSSHGLLFEYAVLQSSSRQTALLNDTLNVGYQRVYLWID